jgi:acyl-CoA reductase-like NAD-dependent aldehyde dehydrogenase
LKMMLNGQRVDATTGQLFPVHNPATGEVIDCVPRADAKDVARAIEVAQKGRAIMAALAAHGRSEIPGKAAEGTATAIGFTITCGFTGLLAVPLSDGYQVRIRKDWRLL